MSINSVVLSGRLGKDPEIRQTNGGKSVAVFTLAVDDGYGDKKSTIWMAVEAWDKTAEAVGRLVSKGKRVAVTGSLKEDTWNDSKTGEKRSRMKVRANQVEIIDFPDAQADGHSEVSDDPDIPF